MKLLKSIALDKYNDKDRYSYLDGTIYGDPKNHTYCLTLYCELEGDENTEYPLEDILDKYYLNCTEYFEEKMIDGRHILICEIEGSLSDEYENFANIKAVKDLIGRRVYNRVTDVRIELVIE